MTKYLDTPVTNMMPPSIEANQEESVAKYERLEDLPEGITLLFDTAFSAAVAIGKEFSRKKAHPLLSLADPRGDIRTERVLRQNKDKDSVTVYDNHGLGISIADKEKAVSLNPGIHARDNNGKYIAFQASLYIHDNDKNPYKPGSDIQENFGIQAPEIVVAFLMTPPTENEPERVEVGIRRRSEEGDNSGYRDMTQADMKVVSNLTQSLASLTERYTGQELKPETSPFFTREAIDGYWNSQD
jgi:hypothetical protein